jgi:mono/diheme cytochrome c family protein
MYTSNRHARCAGWGGLLVVALTTVAMAGSGHQGPFGFGSVPSPEEIRAVDIAVGPDGAGLPSGQGTVAAGEAVYQAKCARCHGPTGTEGPSPRLVGGTLPVRTIGSYWPYATTIFDYVRRAMPIPNPGSLTDREVYALTAWLLHRNGIIGADAVMNAETLPRVRMPNRDGFIPDPRPDVR